MKIETLFLTIAAAALSASARAQSESLALSARSFEAQAAEAFASFVPEDAFAHVPECGILDAKTLRAWTLDEARDQVAPCLAGVARKYSAHISPEVGFL